MSFSHNRIQRHQFLLFPFFVFLFLVGLTGLAGVATPVLASDSGLKVLHPKSVSAGEPFLLQVEFSEAPGILQADWLGKKVTLSPAGEGSGDIYGVSSNKLECILAVPLNSKEKSLPLRITRVSAGGTGDKGGAGADAVYSASIQVTQRDYPSQELTVEPKYVNPDPEILERTKKEAKKNREILTRITPERYWELPLLRPVRGIITSEYGFKRVFNKEPRSQHRGVDFRGAEGTPIKAAAAGYVVLAEDQHYSGNFVILDHGLGIFTLYAHLSEFKVKEGDFVERGQVVGLVGKTGRVTGPHLHFGFSVLGESVTPEPFITDFRPSAQEQKPAGNGSAKQAAN